MITTTMRRPKLGRLPLSEYPRFLRTDDAQWLRADIAAKRLGVTRERVYQLGIQKRLRLKRDRGGLVYYHGDDIVKYAGYQRELKRISGLVRAAKEA
jgi:hypothetical protein